MKDDFTYYAALRFARTVALTGALLLYLRPSMHAQEGMVTPDEGQTWFYSWESTQADNSQGTTPLAPEAIEANYQKILDFVDPQFPSYPFPVVFGDANHNGRVEMYRAIYLSSTEAYMRVYEFDTEMNYTITDIPFYAVPWALGDIDNNGLADLVVQAGDPGFPCDGNGYLRIYESPTSNSFPSVLKASVTLPARKIEYGARIVETDGDGLKEILMSANGCPSDLRIYEWVNDQLVLR